MFELLGEELDPDVTEEDAGGAGKTGEHPEVEQVDRGRLWQGPLQLDHDGHQHQGRGDVHRRCRLNRISKFVTNSYLKVFHVVVAGTGNND